MAKKSSKKRSQGGGRTSNSEPRIQVFKQFGGCNFNDSPRDFDLEYDGQEQSDLQMNYVVIQNNVEISDNQTLETMDAMRKLYSGSGYTGTCIVIKDRLFIALSDGRIIWKRLAGDEGGELSFDSAKDDWTDFEFVDGKLMALSRQARLWHSDALFSDDGTWADGIVMHAPKFVRDPEPPRLDNVTPMGSLKVSETFTQECPFRIGIAWSFISDYGPSKTSNQFDFYASYPVAEWHSGCYAQIRGEAMENSVAVEIYYNVSNANSLQFAGRTDFEGNRWTFDWLGYLDSTSMWPVANLLAPDQNYSQGPHATKMTCIDSRMYFWGDPDEPQRLWIGGNPGNLFSVSPGTAGGFVDVEPGTEQEIRVVKKYKTQSGNSIVTMLCDSPNSTREQRYNLVENTITISNEQNMKSWQAEQVSGAVGCKSYDGAEVCEDGLYSISRYGLALTTMTMEYNSQIRANYVSSPIKPVFTDLQGRQFSNSILMELDGTLYMAFGSIGAEGLDNVIFCYDIDLKSWWTCTLPVDEQILRMFPIDSQEAQEGIGIITATSVYLLPTTQQDDTMVDVIVQTGELSTTQPQQNWQYLSQMEFRFDWLQTDAHGLTIELVGMDQFGREVRTGTTVVREDEVRDERVWMRVDQRIQSYRIRITGKTRFRMSHFMAKVYTMSSKVGLVWGFDDTQGYRADADIHPAFKDYNDIRQAIIP